MGKRTLFLIDFEINAIAKIFVYKNTTTATASNNNSIECSFNTCNYLEILAFIANDLLIEAAAALAFLDKKNKKFFFFWLLSATA